MTLVIEATRESVGVASVVDSASTDDGGLCPSVVGGKEDVWEATADEEGAVVEEHLGTDAVESRYRQKVLRQAGNEQRVRHFEGDLFVFQDGVSRVGNGQEYAFACSLDGAVVRDQVCQDAGIICHVGGSAGVYGP